MSARTLVALALALFTLPVSAQPPRTMPVPVPPGASEDPPAVCFETRILKVPAGFCERTGLKGDALLTDAQLRKVLEAAQEHRDASIVQTPKVTTDDGQTAHVRVCDTQYFVTGVEAMKVKGDTVLVPQNKAIELGDSLAITGTISADGRFVRVEGRFTRVRVEGAVELIPITTQITPIFEGGSQGKPIPFTQFVQVPDVRTEKVERTAVVPAGGATLVLGGWKETGPTVPPTKGKWLFKRDNKEKPAEYEVMVLATVRLPR